jgi:Tfp pilus assembly protein PilF
LKAANKLGRIFQKEGMYGKAIAYYSREAELDPSSGLYGIIGLLCLRQDKYDKAVEFFEKSLRMDSDFSAARTNILAAYHLWALQLIKDKQTDEAVLVLSRALDQFPESRVIIYDLGTAYDASGQYEKAIEQYKKAMKIESSFVAPKGNIASCMNNLGAGQMKKENWEKAIEFCEQALQWDPDFWEARKNLESSTFSLGRKRHDSGLLDEAIPYYMAVLDMNPNNLDARSSLGFALYEKGVYKHALAEFQTALDIDPDFHNAEIGLAAVKRQMNINRAKTAILLTAISLVICISIMFLTKHRRSGRIAVDDEGNLEGS